MLERFGGTLALILEKKYKYLSAGPVMPESRGKAVSIIYLENDLVTRASTP